MTSVLATFRRSEYARQLQSEGWKTLGRNIRNKRGNACQCCRRSDVITHLHHVFYDPDRKDICDYDESDLILLCQHCHRDLHEQLQAFRRCVFARLGPKQFRVLNGALTVALKQYDPLTFVHALAEFVSNPRLVERHADAWRA